MQIDDLPIEKSQGMHKSQVNAGKVNSVTA